MAKIVHWNCRGYRANSTHLRQLLHESNPEVLCLQETMLGLLSPRPPAGYHFRGFSPTGNPVPGDGLAFLIRSDIPFTPHQLDTTLQAMAFTIQTNLRLTICNLYISPSEPLNTRNIRQLIRQLRTPCIIVGDFNCKSPEMKPETIENTRRR